MSKVVTGVFAFQDKFLLFRMNTLLFNQINITHETFSITCVLLFPSRCYCFGAFFLPDAIISVFFSFQMLLFLCFLLLLFLCIFNVCKNSNHITSALNTIQKFRRQFQLVWIKICEGSWDVFFSGIAYFTVHFLHCFFHGPHVTRIT